MLYYILLYGIPIAWQFILYYSTSYRTRVSEAFFDGLLDIVKFCVQLLNENTHPCSNDNLYLHVFHHT